MKWVLQGPCLIVRLATGVAAEEGQGHALCICCHQLVPHSLIHVAVQLICCPRWWSQVCQSYNLQVQISEAAPCKRMVANDGYVLYLVAMLDATHHVVAGVLASTVAAE